MMVHRTGAWSVEGTELQFDQRMLWGRVEGERRE